MRLLSVNGRVRRINPVVRSFIYDLRFAIHAPYGWLSQLRKNEAARDLPKQSILFAFHLYACGRTEIVVPVQVEQAVDDVTDQFRLPRRAELARLPNGVVEADEEFTVKT